jgi:hypothetical protein
LLPHLGEIVIASAHTLQVLDLGFNEWDFSTLDELRDWDTFLVAFQFCTKMRVLTLSGNGLGDKGIETFLRVYLAEMAVSQWEEEGRGDGGETSFRLVKSSDEEDLTESTMESPVEYPSSSTSPLAAAAEIKGSTSSSRAIRSIPSHGLRSIPYIHIAKVGMTDLSVLYLTYILPYHLLPHILLHRLDPKKYPYHDADADDLYPPNQFCRGVTYGSIKEPEASPITQFNPLEEYTPLAKKMLEQVEKVRRAGGLSPPRPASNELHSLEFLAISGSVPPSPEVRGGRTIDSPMGHLHDPASPSRKDSSASSRTTSTPGRSASTASTSLHLNTESLKSRPKFQGEILKATESFHNSQLWSAAVKLLSLARIFLIPPPHKPNALPAQAVWGKPKMAVKVSLPPSPESSLRMPTMVRGKGVGELDMQVWLRILWGIVDTEGCLSERQALHVLSYAADRGTLAIEKVRAGKLPHYQMWRLLEVPSSLGKRLIAGVAMFSL